MPTTHFRPVALGLAPSFGFGDRLGTATPGHLAALQRCGGDIRGMFAQQSIREMARTNRTPDQVMSCAVDALKDADYTTETGSDADHLKLPADVDYTADAGFTFFTIDPSDHVDQKADNYSAHEVDAKYVPVAWADDYSGKEVKLPNGAAITFDTLTVKRAAVKYGKAIEHAVALAAYIESAAEKRSQDHEIEISVDETDQPTTLAEHYIIAEQLIKSGMKLVSLAPRFIGELEKGVDYKGDLAALESSLHDHNAIAEALGPYKLSLHSGSDKLSMYGLFAKATKGRFHVKTAGTSYLEAVRVVARHDPGLFRRVVDFSRDRYDNDRATYHVHATNAMVPAPADVKDDHELEGLYLEHWADVPQGKGFTKSGRQILHCTFGSVLTDPTLGPEVKGCIDAHPDTYKDILDDHFGRHLDALQSGLS